jgi:nucleotide-binding universal stress UspA family protein
VPAELETRPLIVRGEAGRALVRAASQPGDLLVVGTGRRGAVSRLAGGSVSRYCLAHAACPVLAVPPGSLEQQARHGLSRRTFRHRQDLSGLTV